MTPLRLIGHLLLWMGFLCGAFVAVRRTEVSEDPWATIAWPVYATALVVAIAGVIQLRRTKKTAGEEEERHAGNVESMAASLGRLIAQLREWQTPSGRLDVHDVHRQIDQRLSDDLATFSDLRESLIDTFGLEQYAHIMTDFASAERTINRMWSASADGYVDEVAMCLQRAVVHLEAALARLEAARATSNTGPQSMHRPRAT